ncbi:MAG: PRC-barrel domain-containing protein [Selenomonadales bacterium]|nr:PRC-barrel domain-containing protein [Selenomonadales bacterium]MDY3740988.1 PRC-barrel domain-containing protein [Selenomonadaceae bacterium]
MKKSLEILGLPVISITEGRELGMSKSLLIDAKNGTVAAITIEDEDWYRGVKLLPYSSVIAIGSDAVTVTGSDKILTLEDAGDYESMLDANIKIIGTKAITMSGTIQGKVSEIFIGENGKIEKCEIEAADGSLSEITAEQVSIFGKQVTVIEAESEKKTELLNRIKQDDANKPAPQIDPEPEIAAPAPEPEPVAVPEPEITLEPAAPEPEPVIEETVPEPVVEETVVPEVEAETIAETAPEPVVEEPVAEETPKTEAVAEGPVIETVPEPVVEETVEAAPEPVAEEPAKENKKSDPITDRHRRFLLGKTATRQIVSENGVVVVEQGETVTEAILQKASMTNKFIELSMNVQ